MHSSDVSGRDWLISIHKVGLTDIETKERFEFYSSFKRIFQSEKYIDYKQKRCFRDSYVQFRLGISPIRVHRMHYRKDVVPSQLLCPVCKNEIEDESHVIIQMQGLA